MDTKGRFPSFKYAKTEYKEKSDRQKNKEERKREIIKYLIIWLGAVSRKLTETKIKKQIN